MLYLLPESQFRELLKQEGPTLVCVAGGDALKASKEYLLIKEKVDEIVASCSTRYALVEVVNIYDDDLAINPLKQNSEKRVILSLEAIAAKAGGSTY